MVVSVGEGCCKASEVRNSHTGSCLTSRVKFLFPPQGPLRMRNWPRELCNFSTHHPVCLLLFGLLKLTCYFRKEREQALRSIARASALQKLCICSCVFTSSVKLSPERGKHAKHMYRLCFYLEALCTSHACTFVSRFESCFSMRRSWWFPACGIPYKV